MAAAASVCLHRREPSEQGILTDIGPCRGASSALMPAVECPRKSAAGASVGQLIAGVTISGRTPGPTSRRSSDMKVCPYVRSGVVERSADSRRAWMDRHARRVSMFRPVVRRRRSPGRAR